MIQNYPLPQRSLASLQKFLRLVLFSLALFAVWNTPSSAASGARPSSATSAQAAAQEQSGSITEEELRHLLVGKPLYLRGNYLENNLSFNEHGAIAGHAATGSYTLCGVEIEKIRLTKHKAEFIGQRYGLQFFGTLPSEAASALFDRVRISPEKKRLRITIDRERLVKAPKIKVKKGKKGASEKTEADAKSSDKDEKPADPKSVTTTTSPAHAAQMFRDALDKIFAFDIDERMKNAMPEFWQNYFRAVAEKTDYHISNPAVLRQNTVDRKARLLSSIDPGSNEFAQNAGVAGIALFRAVISPDGKPEEIAVLRPIGFGLDENAVAAIRKARFEPALKNGQAVPVLLDLIVQFRIFSARTALKSTPQPADQKSSGPAAPAPVLPGPYSRQP